jgi:hypothetical protein
MKLPDVPARPDVARACAEIVADTTTGTRRMGLTVLRDEFAARLGPEHPAARCHISAGAYAYAARHLAAEQWGVRVRYDADRRGPCRRTGRVTLKLAL